MLKILVCGGREFGINKHGATNMVQVEHLNDMLSVHLGHSNLQIIRGGAKGADLLGGLWAEANDIPVRTFKAEWGRYGKSAGTKRNIKMLYESEPDLVIAFPGGTGSRHMGRLAQKNDVPTIWATLPIFDKTSYHEMTISVPSSNDVVGFHDEYRGFSNFMSAPVSFGRVMFPDVETAYVAAKLSPLEDNYHEKLITISKINSPGKAKKFGRSLTLCQDWDKTKVSIMRALIRQKFSYQKYRKMLLDTGDAYIYEYNDWGDDFWGVVDHKNGAVQGRNNLGHLLMEERECILNE